MERDAMMCPLEPNKKQEITTTTASTSGTEGPILVEVEVGNRKILATIDTGAGASLIDYELAASFPRMQNTTIRLSSINGSPLKDFGFAIVPLRMGNGTVEYPLLIAKDIPCPILLGYDFLEHFGVQIDCKNETIQSDLFGEVAFKNRKLNFIQSLPFKLDTNGKTKKSQKTLLLRANPKKQTNINYLRLTRNVEVPARSQTIVQVKLDREEKDEFVISKREVTEPTG
jgi:predicted aspartyl protease